jgi:heme oxygenase (mycobilin-producing)
MSVVLINPFEVPAEVPEEQFLAGWERAAEVLRSRPGFIGSRLHRSLSPDARFRFINVAEWESPQHFQAAVADPAFAELAKNSPPNFPALYEVARTI